MSYVADGGGGGMTQGEIQQATVDEILSTLTRCKNDLHPGQNLKAVPQHAFGGAATAQALGFHTGQAHNHVLQAVDQLQAGIEAYHVGVAKFRKDVEDTDVTVSRPLLNAVKNLDLVDLFNTGTACTSGSSPADYSQNTSCALPDGEA